MPPLEGAADVRELRRCASPAVLCGCRRRARGDSLAVACNSRGDDRLLAVDFGASEAPKLRRGPKAIKGGRRRAAPTWTVMNGRRAGASPTTINVARQVGLVESGGGPFLMK